MSTAKSYTLYRCSMHLHFINGYVTFGGNNCLNVCNYCQWVFPHCCGGILPQSILLNTCSYATLGSYWASTAHLILLSRTSSPELSGVLYRCIVLWVCLGLKSKLMARHCPKYFLEENAIPGSINEAKLTRFRSCPKLIKACQWNHNVIFLITCNGTKTVWPCEIGVQVVQKRNGGEGGTRSWVYNTCGESKKGTFWNKKRKAAKITILANHGKTGAGNWKKTQGK